MLVGYSKLKESIEADDVCDEEDNALLTLAKGKRIQAVNELLLDELEYSDELACCCAEEDDKYENKTYRR